MTCCGLLCWQYWNFKFCDKGTCWSFDSLPNACKADLLPWGYG